MKNMLNKLIGWLLVNPHPSSHFEKLLSALGALLGILGVLIISHGVLANQGATMLVTSMGASTVLLFAAPHSPLSQPWSVFGGHMLSGAIGITCIQWIDTPSTAAAIAVSMSVLAMYYARCLHPPGGATALAVTMAGESVHALGYTYLVTPVLLNILILLSVAILFNAPFRHRRYPHWLANPAGTKSPDVLSGIGEKRMIAHSDLVYALSQIDSFIDVDEDDLLRIYNLAMKHPDTLTEMKTTGPA